METKKILVTGGAGFIGSTFAERMLKKGHEVIIFDSFIRPGVEYNAERLEGARIIRGDIRLDSDIDKIIGEEMERGWIDWILHTAANPGIKWSIDYPKFDFGTNAVGTLNILEFARWMDASLVFTSTNKVFSGTEINKIPLVEEDTHYRYEDKKFKGIDENFPVDGSDHSIYGVSKLAGDLLCQEYAHNMEVQTVVNRCSCIGGRYQMGVEDQGWFSWFALAAYTDQPLNIYGDGKQVRDVLDGEDLARLFEIEFNEMDKLSGQVFNTGGGMDNWMSLMQCIDYLENKFDITIPQNYKPWRVADQKVYISNTEKVRKMTGWKPKTNPKQLLDKICKWIEDNPRIVEFYAKR